MEQPDEKEHPFFTSDKNFSLIIGIVLCILAAYSTVEYRHILKYKKKLIHQAAENRARLINEADRLAREHLNIALTLANIRRQQK